MANEEFVQKFNGADSREAAYQLLVDNGVDASYEDFLAYLQESRDFMLEKGLMSEDGELSPEMLDAVSGGSARGRAILTLTGVVCLCAGHPGLALGCFVLARFH